MITRYFVTGGIAAALSSIAPLTEELTRYALNHWKAPQIVNSSDNESIHVPSDASRTTDEKDGYNA
jgi:hypothetical protein